MQMLAEALRLQSDARRLTGERDRGIADQYAFEARLTQWTQERIEFAALTPESPLDALTQLHSISQAATALLSSRDCPASIDGLAAELIVGLSSLIKYHEQIIGRTCDELALFHEYSPPTGLN